MGPFWIQFTLGPKQLPERVPITYQAWRKGGLLGLQLFIYNTWKTVQRVWRDNLFWTTENSFARGLRKSAGLVQCSSKFCTVSRMSISVSWKKQRGLWRSQNMEDNHSLAVRTHFMKSFNETFDTNMCMSYTKQDLVNWNMPINDLLTYFLCGYLEKPGRLKHDTW